MAKTAIQVFLTPMGATLDVITCLRYYAVQVLGATDCGRRYG